MQMPNPGLAGKIKMDALLLLAIVVSPCFGFWALVKAKRRIVRILGVFFCSLAVGLVVGIAVAISRAWSGGNGNTAFFVTTALCFVVLLPFALRKTVEHSKKV